MVSFRFTYFTSFIVVLSLFGCQVFAQKPVGKSKPLSATQKSMTPSKKVAASPPQKMNKNQVRKVAATGKESKKVKTSGQRSSQEQRAQPAQVTPAVTAIENSNPSQPASATAPVLTPTKSLGAAGILSQYGQQVVKIGATTKNGSRQTGNGFVVTPYFIATLYENVSAAWAAQTSLWIEVRGQRVAATIYSVDLLNNLAVLRPQTPVGTSTDRLWMGLSLNLSPFQCFYMLGYDQSEQLRVATQPTSSEFYGGPCFDDQGRFIGLSSRDGNGASPRQGQMVAHFQTISKMPASLPQWKLQVLSQNQVWQDQVLQTAFRSDASGNARSAFHLEMSGYRLGINTTDFLCDKSETTPWGRSSVEDISQLSAWSCRRGGIAWFPTAKMGSIEIYAASWSPASSSRLENLFSSNSALGLSPMISSWYADLNRFEGSTVTCKKNQFQGDLGVNLNIHLCVLSHNDSSNLSSAILRVARQDVKEPFVTTGYFRGFSDKNLSSLMDRYVKSIARAP